MRRRETPDWTTRGAFRMLGGGVQEPVLLPEEFVVRQNVERWEREIAAKREVER